MRPPEGPVLAAAVEEVAAALEAPEFGTMLRTLVSVQAILQVMVRDWDTAASDRMSEIETLRELLQRVGSVAPEPLGSELLTAAEESVPSDLRISRLDAVRDRLLTGLVDAESYLESAEATDQIKSLRSDLRSFEHAFASRYAILRQRVL